MSRRADRRFEALFPEHGSGGVEQPLADITLDARKAVGGGLFLAVAGGRRHGLEFLDQARQRKVAAVVWEPVEGGPGIEASDTLPAFPVPELRHRLGEIANRFFDYPSKHLKVAGITGTNGKTTCAFLIAEALTRLGQHCGYIGTMGVGSIRALRPTELTTPDCIEVHRNLARMRQHGAGHVAMEVSSHALEQGRVDGVVFDVVALTNLSRDHLDYHGSLADYAAAKTSLFRDYDVRQRVINTSSELGRALLEEFGGDPGTVALAVDDTGVGNSSPGLISARMVETGHAGLRLEVDGIAGALHIDSRLMGGFNAENILLALAILWLWGCPGQAAAQALSQTPAPPGRMEVFGGGEGTPLVVIDFAHTPDALTKALGAVRAHCAGALWCVFGCGGDRDRGKRSEMGKAAAGLADHVVLTNDNPRAEDPDRIIAEIESGMGDARPYLVEPKRGAAIRQTLDSAAANDAVLIAGKGDEAVQLIGDTRVSYSDRKQVLEWLGSAA